MVAIVLCDWPENNQQYTDHVICAYVVAVPPTTPQSDKFSDVTELIL